MVDFYNRMKETRINNEKSQKEVADRLRISQQQYSLYENGKRYIPVDLLKDFCELMDCSADYILGIERRTGKTNRSDCTKYTFLYSYVPKSQATLSGGFFSLQSAPHGVLPKNVIETRYRPLRGLGL